MPKVRAQYRLLSKFLAMFCFSSLKAGKMNCWTCCSCKKSSVSFFSMPWSMLKWMNANMLNEAPSTIDYTQGGNNALGNTYDIRSGEELGEELEVDQQLAEHLLGHLALSVVFL